MPKKKFHILCINSGSSSLKFSLYRMTPGDEHLITRGEIERIGLKDGIFWMRAQNKKHTQRATFRNHKAAIDTLFKRFDELSLPFPDAVGHRIVLGGSKYTRPIVIDQRVISALQEIEGLAPLHLPGQILCLEAFTKRYKKIKQVACFDTSFHSRIPEIARRFALPNKFWEKGIKKYGFHGLSYEYILSSLKNKNGKIIIAHLGNGSSMAAILNGRPIETTMGFTPAGGFMMGTRPGDLDPGVMIYLMKEMDLDVQRLDHMINNESGLLGVSEISPDMKAILERMEHSEPAKIAFKMFCYQVRKTIGALAAALNGLNTLIFTAGIGERSAQVREEICKGLGFLGVSIDEKANLKHEDIISKRGAQCTVRVIPTNEDLVISRHTMRLVK